MKDLRPDTATEHFVDLVSEAVIPVQVVGTKGAFVTYARPFAGFVGQYQCPASALAPTRADGLRLLAERMEMAARSRVELAEAALANAKREQERVGAEATRMRAEASGPPCEGAREVAERSAA